jgi:hypothetical protein
VKDNSQSQFDKHVAALEEDCYNSKNTTFQERRKTTGRAVATASKEQ